MSENVLKKEFDKRAVQRVRNLLTGKSNEGTTTQAGYQKQSDEHAEGDTWEENGKTWIFKNGFKQSVTKLDDFKKLTHIPILCPTCSNPLQTTNDKRMYNMHKMCMTCVLTFESKLKLEGKYEQYSKDLMNGNIDHYLKEYSEYLIDAIKSTSVNSHISEAGDIEKWIGNNKTVIEDAQKQLENIQNSR